jgi:hypothetical protein
LCYNEAMLDELTIETFQPLIGSSFWLHTTNETGKHKIEVRLEETKKVMENEAARLKRHPFSLYFLGPGSLYLEQKTYHLTHDAFPDGLEIFLVPIGKDTQGYHYEAAFA